MLIGGMKQISMAQVVGIKNKYLYIYCLEAFNVVRGDIIVNEQVRYYKTFVSPLDPCPPIRIKSYSTPPQLFIPFQPPNLPQFTAFEALKHGTLWPLLYSPYDSKNVRQEEGD